MGLGAGHWAGRDLHLALGETPSCDPQVLKDWLFNLSGLSSSASLNSLTGPISLIGGSGWSSRFVQSDQLDPITIS